MSSWSLAPSTLGGVSVSEVVLPGRPRGTHVVPSRPIPGGPAGFYLIEGQWYSYGTVSMEPVREPEAAAPPAEPQRLQGGTTLESNLTVVGDPNGDEGGGSAVARERTSPPSSPAR